MTLPDICRVYQKYQTNWLNRSHRWFFIDGGYQYNYNLISNYNHCQVGKVTKRN